MFAKNPFPAVFFSARRRVRTVLMASLAMASLAACTAKTGTGQFNDPYQAQNRENHKFNVAFDSNVLKPASQAYGHVLPGPVRQGVSNFANNLSLPSYVLNDLFQARIYDAADNTLRFAFNTIFGIGGIFDPAGAMGLHAKSNDFGHTLYAWGAREGAYLEVPFLGPSTERALAGKVVDAVTNPTRLLVPQSIRNVPYAADAGSLLDYRYRFNDTVDSILHGSSDSYGQERLIYLEQRHYALGIQSNASMTNPYEDPYASSK